MRRSPNKPWNWLSPEFHGSITYKNSEKSHRVIRAMPMSRLLLGNRRSFLTPEPYAAGAMNGIRLLRAEKIAALRSVSMEGDPPGYLHQRLPAVQIREFRRYSEIAYRWKNALF
jgi:hypothetical protein